MCRVNIMFEVEGPEIFCCRLVAIILFLLGSAYAIFHVLSLSMEILPEEITGVFNVIAGLGEALGLFLGSFTAEKFGFTHLF